MITWITENVAIGEYTDAVNEELLKNENIDCVLSLRGYGVEEADSWERIVCETILKIDYYRIPVAEDNDRMVKLLLRTAAYMLEQLTEKYKRILVHCTAGIDRAPFVVAYWIIKRDIIFAEITGYDYTEGDLKYWIADAYKIIKEKRPQIVEHMEWV